MINLTLYGKPTSVYSYIHEVITRTADKAGVQIHVEEITDTQVFIDKQIMSIPAYQLNGAIKQRGDKKLNQFLREMQISLLRNANFGIMKKIFVPIDYTNTSDNAVSYATNLSKHFNSVLKLIHAFHPSPKVYDGTYVVSELQSTQEEKLAKYAETLNNNWHDDAKTPIIDHELRIGFAYDEIKTLSMENKSGWIVMGSSNYSKTIKNIFGSVSVAVAKNCDCPVFIIPPNAQFAPIKKIALCSSGELLDVQARDELLELAKTFDAEIHIIHAQDSVQLNEERNFISLGDNSYPENKLQQITLTGENHIDLINEYCKENDIQLLAMARRKRSIFGELFHKSFTKQLTITTDIPLLVLHK